MRPRLALLLAGLLFAAACGGGNGDSGGLTSGGPADDNGDGLADVVVMDGSEVQVSALDNTFRVADIQVKPGTKVVWENKGRNDHDVLPVSGDAWGVQPDGFAPGDVYSTTFDEPGVYRYYCSIHGTTDEGMVGAVVVSD
ncbi:MAG TPA: plastocyanin/azurin family copper-binding protein [Acidimicrobiales bacterium]|nr:plastocyanin/azurin family copper-binding protein [Acidimicrobiales bacterium]